LVKETPFAQTLRLCSGLKALSKGLGERLVVRQAHHERLSEQYWVRLPHKALFGVEMTLDFDHLGVNVGNISAINMSTKYSGAVKGGDLYRRYPALVLVSPDAAEKEGRWIPTTAVDQYGATLAR
jgi:hypothetical protein